MYKTVRHGENSLQYTILPQQDDGGSAGAGSARGGARRRARTRGRTATILVMTLILACGVVGAAVVVPLLVSADLVALPSAFQRFSNQHHHGGHHGHHNIAQRNRSGALTTSTTTTTTTTAATFTPGLAFMNNVSNTAATTDVTTSEENLNTLTTTSSDKADTAAPPQSPEEATSTMKLTVTTIEQVTTTFGDLLNDGAQGHGGGSKKKALQDDMSANVRNSTTRVAAFASVTPVETGSDMTTTIGATQDDVVVVPVRTTDPPKYHSWLETRWPFADPSSYFQWTAYNKRDSLLLPLILGGAMMVLLTAICICYTLRRRRQKTLRRETIGKISSDLQAGDKATLLPDGSEEE